MAHFYGAFLREESDYRYPSMYFYQLFMAKSAFNNVKRIRNIFSVKIYGYYFRGYNVEYMIIVCRV